MNPRPQPFRAEPTVVEMDRSPRGILVGHHTPRAAPPIQVQDAIDDLPHVDRPRPTTWLGWRNPGLYERPLLIRQVTGIGCPFHILVVGRKPSKWPLFTDALRRQLRSLAGSLLCPRSVSLGCRCAQDVLIKIDDTKYVVPTIDFPLAAHTIDPFEENRRGYPCHEGSLSVVRFLSFNH